MMFCSKCGVKNEDNTNFCVNCGAPLEAAPQQPVYQQPPYQQPTYQQPTYQQPTYQQSPTIPGKGLGIAGLVLGIVSLMLLYTNNNSTLIVLFLAFVCIFSSVTGIILSSMAKSKAKAVGLKNGIATAGLICSCIATGIFTIQFIIGFMSSFASSL